LVAFEIVYVLAGLYLVRSGQVEHWLNKSPEKRTIRFDAVFTIIPGVAHVRGLRMTSQGRGDQLELVVDSAAGFVDPFELLARRIHIAGLRARGVEFRYRKRPKTPEEAQELLALVPPIEGVPFEPYDGPPKQPRTKPGWTLVFTRTTVREIREVWMGPFRLEGPAEVTASVTVGSGDDKRISIRAADVTFRGGELRSGGETSLHDLDLRVRGRMEPFFQRQTQGVALLSLISARVELSGTSPEPVLINQYFAKADWLEFGTGERKVTAGLDVERGRILPGSHVELVEAPLRVDLAGFIAEGLARARVETLAGEGNAPPQVRVEVSYSRYGMRRQVDGPPMMRGDGLRIEARSPADLAHLPPEDFDGRIELGHAEFPDLTFVNEFLPEGGGLTVGRGRATVEGALDVTEGKGCRGSVVIATKDLVVDAGGVENSGNVRVRIEIPEGDLRERRFDLAATRVDLSDFAFTSRGSTEGTPDWRGRLDVEQGSLDLGDVPKVDARLGLTFSDSRPLVAFLSRDEPLSGWKEKMLTIGELQGEAVVALTAGTTSIRHLGLRGGKVDVRFRAVVDSRGAFGKARARYGPLKAGIGLEGTKRTLKVIGVGNWYKRDDVRGVPKLMPEFEEVGAS